LIRPVVEVERAADLLLEALGLPAHLDRDLGLARLRGRERHLAGIGVAVDRAPGDALVGDLLRDLGVPLGLCRPWSGGSTWLADEQQPRYRSEAQ